MDASMTELRVLPSWYAGLDSKLTTPYQPPTRPDTYGSALAGPLFRTGGVSMSPTMLVVYVSCMAACPAQTHGVSHKACSFQVLHA